MCASDPSFPFLSQLFSSNEWIKNLSSIFKYKWIRKYKPNIFSRQVEESSRLRRQPMVVGILQKTWGWLAKECSLQPINRLIEWDKTVTYLSRAPPLTPQKLNSVIVERNVYTDFKTCIVILKGSLKLTYFANLTKQKFYLFSSTCLPHIDSFPTAFLFFSN